MIDSPLQPSMSSIFDVYNEPVEITLLHKDNKKIKVPCGTPSIDILEKDPDIVAVLSNNEILSL